MSLLSTKERSSFTISRAWGSPLAISGSYVAIAASISCKYAGYRHAGQCKGMALWIPAGLRIKISPEVNCSIFVILAALACRRAADNLDAYRGLQTQEDNVSLLTFGHIASSCARGPPLSGQEFSTRADHSVPSRLAVLIRRCSYERSIYQLCPDLRESRGKWTLSDKSGIISIDPATCCNHISNHIWLGSRYF